MWCKFGGIILTQMWQYVIFALPACFDKYTGMTEKLLNYKQGFIFKNDREALNCSPERFKESCQESDSYKHHWILTILIELNSEYPMRLEEYLGEQKRVIALPLLKNECLDKVCLKEKISYAGVCSSRKVNILMRCVS